MKFLENLTKKKQLFQRTIGLHFEQFNLLVKRVEPLWQEAELQRKIKADRKRCIGAGHPYKLSTLEEKTLIILLYYKIYATQELLGLLVGLDQGNISKLIKKIMPLLEKAADPELATYLAEAKEQYLQQSPQKRISNWADFLKKHPDLKDVSTDATEQKCFRSQDNEQQKKYYSGKKKQHSAKTQITVSEMGRILDVSKTYPGSVHDKTVIDQEKTIKKFPEKTCQRFDSGYQGIMPENPKHYIVLPIKKQPKEELSELAKEFNQTNSKRRIVVEHAFARIKKFRICGNVYRGEIGSYNQTFRGIVAILNFKLTHPAAAAM